MQIQSKRGDLGSTKCCCGSMGIDGRSFWFTEDCWLACLWHFIAIRFGCIGLHLRNDWRISDSQVGLGSRHVSLHFWHSLEFAGARRGSNVRKHADSIFGTHHGWLQCHEHLSSHAHSWNLSWGFAMLGCLCACRCPWGTFGFNVAKPQQHQNPTALFLCLCVGAVHFYGGSAIEGWLCSVDSGVGSYSDHDSDKPHVLAMNLVVPIHPWHNGEMLKDSIFAEAPGQKSRWHELACLVLEK